MLYLDNAATTPILPEVSQKMFEVLTEQYGNASSKYYSQANEAKDLLSESRNQVASLLGAEPSEVVFTSGATESNNMILKGVYESHNEKGRHIITSKAEHSSILDICAYLESQGADVTYLDVDQFGRVSVDQLADAIREDTILISLLWANNELGSLNPIQELAAVAAKNHVYFHTDATQAVGKLPIKWPDIPGVTFLSASAHKLYGPKGIGCVVIREDHYKTKPALTPLIHGGGQESGLRSGTHSLHNIAGFGLAAELAKDRLKKNHRMLNELETIVTEKLHNRFQDRIEFNSDTKDKIPGVVNVRFKGINNEILLKKIAPVIAASSGSACSSSKPSHVLQAIGLTLNEVRESVRFSLSPYIEKKELGIFDQL